MTNEQYEKLKAPFENKYLKWRVGATNKEKTSGMAVAYLDSRAVQNRLDDVIGAENWQSSYEVVESFSKNEPVAFICKLSIFNAERNEWIAKSNGASSTDVEPVKGGFSDAFKRAASTWGIGRYLYDLGSVWVNIEQFGNSYKIKESEKAKLNLNHSKLVNLLGVKTAPKTQSKIQPTLKPQSDRVYTVSDARYYPNENHTVIVLKNDEGNEISGFYGGEAKVAKNQKVSAKIKKKGSPSGEYFVISECNIAA